MSGAKTITKPEQIQLPVANFGLDKERAKKDAQTLANALDKPLVFYQDEKGNWRAETLANLYGMEIKIPHEIISRNLRK